MDICQVERAAPSSPVTDETAPAAPAPAEHPAASVTLFVCVTCGAEGDGRPARGEALLQAARAAGAPAATAIEPVRCLANCKRALSAAIARADGWTYVFGDLDDDSAGDLIEGARLLALAEDRLMPWRGRPERLKRGMVARIPPLFPSKDHP
jgi:predicted metal-binding protein